MQGIHSSKTSGPLQNVQLYNPVQFLRTKHVSCYHDMTFSHAADGEEGEGMERWGKSMFMGWVKCMSVSKVLVPL
jgi:hypothetical protein